MTRDPTTGRFARKHPAESAYGRYFGVPIKLPMGWPFMTEMADCDTIRIVGLSSAFDGSYTLQPDGTWKRGLTERERLLDAAVRNCQKEARRFERDYLESRVTFRPPPWWHNDLSVIRAEFARLAADTNRA